ncbi:MAG: serine/threonine protein phosphatase [Clostridia bacterium]|nr:serine/threonine protein phosphatase [Clostridia bacterium]
MRSVIIGDIHGCSGALDALIRKIGPDEAMDRLILLGDLFDRGPASWEVFRSVRDLEARFGDRFVLLRGNHEDYLLQKKLPFFLRLTWERVGRQATVNSFREHDEKMESAIPWMEAHCRLFFKGEDFQCVHAGLMIDPIEANDTFTLMHDHDIVRKNVYKGPLTVTGHIALREPAWFTGDGKTVRKLAWGERYRLPDRGTMCIDTGCGKGGRLTGMIVEEGIFRLESVPEAP